MMPRMTELLLKALKLHSSMDVGFICYRVLKTSLPVSLQFSLGVNNHLGDQLQIFDVSLAG